MILNPSLIDSIKFDLIEKGENFKKLNSLLNHCFLVPEDKSYFDDFPVWDPCFDSGSLVRVGLFLREQILSTASVRITFLKIKNQNPIRIAVLGGVATHPEWRSQGLARKVIDFAVQWAQAQGACLIFLFTPYSHDEGKCLYRDMGFEWIGQQLRVPLSQILFPKESCSLKVHFGWNPQIFDWIQRRSDGFLYEEKDRDWFSSHQNVEWCYFMDRGVLKAYAGLGRGIDLQGIIHEWGGEVRSLLILLQVMKRQCPEWQVLCSPYHQLFSSKFSPLKKTEPVCMVKLLKDPQFYSGLKFDFLIKLYKFLWIWGLDAA